MLHRLTIGHLDPVAMERRQAVPMKALEMDVVDRLLAELGQKDGERNATLGGCKVAFQNAYVSCLWKSGRTNRVAEEFALRLQRETGCTIAEFGGYRVIEPTELVGLNGQASGVHMFNRTVASEGETTVPATNKTGFPKSDLWLAGVKR